jgi:LysR family transcriptional regulator of abg operon
LLEKQPITEDITLKNNQIEAFISIAEGRGVAGAADKLFVTQPAITKSISNLEAELGVPLFDRSRHRLELNEFGEILFRRATAARAELERAREEISLMKESGHQCIKFNGSPAIIPKLIPKAINFFKQTHPNVHVELAGLAEDSPANKIKALIKGEYDLLITVIDENEPNLGLSYDKLLDVSVIFIASNGHPALELVNPSLKDLAQYHWLFPGAGGLPFQKLRAAFRRADVPIPKNVSTIANRQIIFSLLEEGMYLAAIPYHPACLEKNMEDLNIINIDIESINWPIDLIRRENTVLSPALSDFIDQIKNLVSSST